MDLMDDDDNDVITRDEVDDRYHTLFETIDSTTN